MKIYFTASISGGSENGNNYKAIVSSIESMGHEIMARHILDVSSDSLKSESLEEREQHYKKVEKWISKSDLVVVESSHPSTNVGYEISMALEREKPVLCLHVKDKVPVLLMGVNTDKFRVVEYDIKSLKSLLEVYLDELSKLQDTRFNFFISPKIGIYLDWVSKKKRVPRAVFLRRLIEDDMKKAGYEE